MLRKKLIAGNWKMNKTPADGAALVAELVATVGKQTDVDVVVCPPFTALDAVAKVLDGSTVKLGAQNLHPEASGAFTGEVSAPMLRALFTTHAIIGHSERRSLFGETDAFINQKVLAALRTGDMVQVVRIALSGDAIEPLFSLPGGVAYICERTGGDLFVGMLDRSGTLLRFPLEGGNPETLAGDSGGVPMHPLQLPDGRFLVPSVSAGRRKLLAGGMGEALRPFLEVQDQSGPPVVMVGPDVVAFLTGPAGGGAPRLALASARDGRILKRFEETAGMVPQSLTVGTDGRSLFFTEKGRLLELPVAGGAPRPLCAGDGVAADPGSGGLIVQRNGTAGVELFRRTPDGSETPILVAGDLLPSALPISGRAVAADGRILLTATPRGGWTSAAALLDPHTGALVPIPVLFPGDVYAPTWGPDGKVLAVGSGSRSELWLFRARGPARAGGPRVP